MRALEYLMATSPVDALVAVFSIPDVASHVLWEYWIAGDDDIAQSPQLKEMKAAYVTIWRDVDEAVGQVLEYLASDGNAMVVSDHGFGSSHGVFHVNQWLLEAGYLVRKSEGRSRGNQIREWLIKMTTPFLGGLYKRILGSKAHQLLRASILREIDLKQSRAFALDSSDACGGIYINRHFARESDLNEEAFVRKMSARLKKDLLAFGESEGLAISVYSARELYSGEKVDLAPELLLNVEDGACSVSYRFEHPIYADRRHHPMKSGTHRLNGILLAAGSKVKPGVVEGASLQDIAPTFLSLSDAPIPTDCDGQVLADLIKPEHLPEPSTIEGTETETFAVDEEEEDIEAVLQRLADLGYLD
jgi:predicted AlkP superfamily phosphohydrolase/phosphomutase